MVTILEVPTHQISETMYRYSNNFHYNSNCHQCNYDTYMGGDVTKSLLIQMGHFFRNSYHWKLYSHFISGTDLIGNPYVAGTQSITFRVDTTSPTLTITTPPGPKVSNSSLVVTLTYDEAVTGLTTNTAQFSEAINIASLQLLGASSDGRTYTVRITPQAEGLVKLTHAPGSPPVQDLAGNSIASTVSCSFTYDTSSPEVLLRQILQALHLELVMLFLFQLIFQKQFLLHLHYPYPD